VTPDDLVDIELIKRLKYRYLRYLDQKLFDEMREVFTPDATARYSGGHYSYDGVEDIITFLKESMGSEGFLSSHRCHHPEIDIVGPDSATGVWALEDTVIIEDLGISLRGAAFYSDEYVRTADGWRISHTGYKRTFEEMHPRGSIEGLQLTASWWGTGGQSSL
jgi:hypothetical protein